LKSSSQHHLYVDDLHRLYGLREADVVRTRLYVKVSTPLIAINRVVQPHYDIFSTCSFPTSGFNYRVALTGTRQGIASNVLSFVGVRDAHNVALGHILRSNKVISQWRSAGVAAGGRVPEAEVCGGGCLALLHWASRKSECSSCEDG
jgi:hypothetical protein